ncbi:MAG: hypothetical protein IT215_08300 [Chitinophagaceae bacterium]|nr:MAG: hypothetical protein UZ11_BCD004001576 [Bacteroidetes bacterium OLB11]MCC6448672.1 hypothetical protein [Chitinophagaceae bacterium]HMN31835.1 hypothetical protein [Chitinophagaceae bacterium]
MELSQFIQILNEPINNLSETNHQESIKILYQKYPFASSINYLHFASLSLQKNAKALSDSSFNELSIYKANPLHFIEYCNELKLNKNFNKNTHQNDNEDILALINEIPNSNPINKTPPKQRKQSSKEAPENTSNIESPSEKSVDKNLMVMMSFTDWLLHFKTKNEREKEELKEKKALKTVWKKEKFTSLSEEEDEDIPDEIFKQAMDSISDNAIISESMAIILVRQKKYDKAIDMYKKLSLQNPEKSAYFATQINILKNNKDI